MLFANSSGERGGAAVASSHQNRDRIKARIIDSLSRSIASSFIGLFALDGRRRST
jgi:hypothetical protein